MNGQDQIRIVQAGVEIFAFDTINWPKSAFQYPIVYTAACFNHTSHEANCIGWKYIKREQFEWLVKHYSCLVSYTGADLNDGHTFYCNNHKCWERHGKDFWALEDQVQSYYREPELDEERVI